MLRRKVPNRTCGRTYTQYSSYKEFLRDDFNKRCGYCDITDHILGGKKIFHIDHFAPKKFANRINDYSNLVYSCPSCNIAKSDDWPMNVSSPSNNGSEGYIDPCDSDYDLHLERELSGQIVAKTAVGSYMYKQLKLYLLKHKYLWMYDILSDQVLRIRKALSESNEINEDTAKLKIVYEELTDKFMMYLEINRSDQ